MTCRGVCEWPEGGGTGGHSWSYGEGRKDSRLRVQESLGHARPGVWNFEAKDKSNQTPKATVPLPSLEAAIAMAPRKAAAQTLIWLSGDLQ